MEWWSYGLSDFLMFSPRVYLRLVARYNEATWPAQLLALGAGLALLGLAARGATRAPALLLAAAWAATGWGFHWTRYADIFLAAPWLAGACAVQAVLLLGGAFVPAHRAGGATKTGGLALILAGVALTPLLTAFAGQGWPQAEVAGMMPDPTALATLGWLWAAHALPAWTRAVLAVLPALSLLLGVATRIALAQ